MKNVRWAWCVAAGASTVSLACADLLGIGDVPTPLDALAPDATGSDAATQDELPSFDASGCDACATIQNGWVPLLVSKTGAPCPAGYAPSTTLQTSPTFEAGACTCNAANIVPPRCDVGTASIILGCNGSTVSFAVADGGCTPVSATLSSTDSVPTIDASGGSCTAQAQADPGKVGETTLTTCAPSACPVEVCTGEPPNGFSACIETLGAATCPADFPNAMSAAAAYTLDCSAACGGCTVSATCQNATLTLYDSCGGGLVTAIVADGTCHTEPPAPVGAAVYAALPPTNQMYQPDPPKAPSAIAQNERTVCCR